MILIDQIEVNGQPFTVPALGMPPTQVKFAGGIKHKVLAWQMAGCTILVGSSKIIVSRIYTL